MLWIICWHFCYISSVIEQSIRTPFRILDIYGKNSNDRINLSRQHMLQSSNHIFSILIYLTIVMFVIYILIQLAILLEIHSSILLYINLSIYIIVSLFVIMLLFILVGKVVINGTFLVLIFGILLLLFILSISDLCIVEIIPIYGWIIIAVSNIGFIVILSKVKKSHKSIDEDTNIVLKAIYKGFDVFSPHYSNKVQSMISVYCPTQKIIKDILFSSKVLQYSMASIANIGFEVFQNFGEKGIDWKDFIRDKLILQLICSIIMTLCSVFLNACMKSYMESNGSTESQQSMYGMILQVCMMVLQFVITSFFGPNINKMLITTWEIIQNIMFFCLGRMSFNNNALESFKRFKLVWILSIIVWSQVSIVYYILYSVLDYYLLMILLFDFMVITPLVNYKYEHVLFILRTIHLYGFMYMFCHVINPIFNITQLILSSLGAILYVVEYIVNTNEIYYDTWIYGIYIALIILIYGVGVYYLNINWFIVNFTEIASFLSILSISLKFVLQFI